MPPSAPYTRIILNGIPFWKDTEGTLYYYESSVTPTPESRIALGTEADGLFPDWKDRLAAPLENYRAAEKPRVRILDTSKRT